METYPMPVVVDIYARVSTDDQEENTSLDEQEAVSRQYCRDNNLIVGMVHREVFSGYQYRERKKLELIRQRYRDGKIKGVVIRTLDRLSRSQIHNAILMEEMEHHEVKLFCIKENIDDTPMGKFVRMILAFVAEMEREKIMDRTMTGRLNKAKEGKIVGGKNPRYGWKWHDPIEKDYLELDEKAANVIRLASIAYADGVPCMVITDQLNKDRVPAPSKEVEWSMRTLNRYLTDVRNTGKSAQMFTNPKKGAKQNFPPIDLPDGTYPQIVDEAVFERIMMRTAANKEESKRNGKHPTDYLLRAGFIRCAECGRAMIGCDIRNKKRHTGPRLAYVSSRSNVCLGHRVPSIDLDNEVWGKLMQLADHINLIEEAIQLATSNDSTEANLKAVDNTIANWEDTANNYTEDLKDRNLRGDTRASIRRLLDESLGMIENLKSERTLIMAGAYNKEREKKAYGSLLEWCKKVKTAREDLTYQEKRDFLRMLGVMVIVHRRNRNHEEMSYEIQVSLPSIQEIIYQNGGVIVGHSST